MVVAAFIVAFFFEVYPGVPGEFSGSGEAGHQMPPEREYLTLQITDSYLGCRHRESRQEEIAAGELPALSGDAGKPENQRLHWGGSGPEREFPGFAWSAKKKSSSGSTRGMWRYMPAGPGGQAQGDDLPKYPGPAGRGDCRPGGGDHFCGAKRETPYFRGIFRNF